MGTSKNSPILISGREVIFCSQGENYAERGFPGDKSEQFSPGAGKQHSMIFRGSHTYINILGIIQPGKQ
jgi:hypothetical protein